MKGKRDYLQSPCSEHQRAGGAGRGAWHLHSFRRALWWWHQTLTLCKLLCWCCYSSHRSAPAAQLLPCSSDSLTFQQSALSTLLPLLLDTVLLFYLVNLHIIGFFSSLVLLTRFNYFSVKFPNLAASWSSSGQVSSTLARLECSIFSLSSLCVLHSFLCGHFQIFVRSGTFIQYS